ncbi:MAG: hypothetical protein QNJ65_21205 [Xenococcaceae cyanobacterium MO_234.B1]|nr:hypothetical protein [Xenococcaceae cyanobacterium MO_234.B1]
MKHAVSMYLGGVVLNASECDFDSSRELGLKCAICNQAVFLRSGSTRQQVLRNGKVVKQIISPYFTHYKTGSGEDFDCENRVYSKPGKTQLKRLEIEGRNQRLKLYNKHLWEMYKDDTNLMAHQLKSNKKRIGQRFLENLAIVNRKKWAEKIALVYKSLEYENERLLTVTKEEYKKTAESWEQYEDLYQDTDINLKEPNLKTVCACSYQEFLEHQNYFKYKCDRRLHLSICQEIADFMCTKTSGYFWLNLIASITKPREVIDRAFDRQIVRESLSSNLIFLITVRCIYSVHWLEQINKRLGETHLIAEIPARIRFEPETKRF